jgi:hypothetical protein
VTLSYPKRIGVLCQWPPKPMPPVAMELDPGLETRPPRRLANPRWRLITSPCRITISKPAATDEAIVGEWTHPVDWLPSDDENRSLPATCSAQSINDESVVRTLACSHGDRNDPTSSDCGTPSESSDVAQKTLPARWFPPLPLNYVCCSWLRASAFPDSGSKSE